MKIAVITPAYNEENYIQRTLESVTRQTLKPDCWMIVDDGSTDTTLDLVTPFQKSNPWIQTKRRPKKFGHEAGAAVVRAFHYGLERLPFQDFDIIFKLDADLTLPENYFERVVEEYAGNTNLGMCGGICVIKDSRGYIYEPISDTDHLRGAVKSYRSACFEQIGKVRAVYGWDTLDELLALYNGWEVKVLPELRVIHHRRTHTESKSLKIYLKTGRSFHIMGYGTVLAFISSLKQIAMPPKVLSSVFMVAGYLGAWVSNQPKAVSPEEGRFIRSYRFKRAIKRVKRTFTPGV